MIVCSCHILHVRETMVPMKSKAAIYIHIIILLHLLLLCSWTTHLIARIAPKIEECHGGLSLEHFMEIQGMKNSTPSLSTSNGFSLHLNKETYVS
ncbi:hypothetical protein P8452_16227 [Trifolium repens]|nr:hypothetical protein P8452_16227 [Trifolium repens]